MLEVYVILVVRLIEVKSEKFHLLEVVTKESDKYEYNLKTKVTSL